MDRLDEVDALIQSAVEAEDRALLSDGHGEEHVFSDRYHEKMRALYKTSAKRTRRGFPFHKRLAACVLAAVLLGGTLTARAFWPELLSFFQSIHSMYTDLRILPSQSPSPPTQDETLAEWGAYWYPVYLPEGFRFDSATGIPQWGILTFKTDQNESLVFEQWYGAMAASTDNEGTPVPGIAVKEFETYAVEKSMGTAFLRTVAWSDGTMSFKLTGRLSFETLVKIAEHITYIENEEEPE